MWVFAVLFKHPNTLTWISIHYDSGPITYHIQLMRPHCDITGNSQVSQWSLEHELLLSSLLNNQPFMVISHCESHSDLWSVSYYGHHTCWAHNDLTVKSHCESHYMSWRWNHENITVWVGADPQLVVNLRVNHHGIITMDYSDLTNN